jgi:hypothetical protein
MSDDRCGASSRRAEAALALAGAARDVERADEVDLRNGGVDQYVVSYHHGLQRVGLDSSRESSHATASNDRPLLRDRQTNSA